MFCEIFRTQNNTLHTLRLVSPWGCPGNPAYPTAQRGYPTARGHTLLPNTLHSTQHTLREATLWPRDFRRPLYGQETAPTVSPAYPAYPKLQTEHTHAYPAYTAFEKAPGARLQDYKTANIASQQKA